MSAVAVKNEEFLREAFFRLAWEDATAVLGARAVATFQRHAVVLFKPEALVGDRVRPALDYLDRHGFVPIAWDWARMDRVSINTIWRFQWNVATADRLDIAEVLYCCGDSLLVFFADVAAEPSLPSTVRLRTLKGPAQVENQQPHQLRFAIRAPNRTMSMIHAPDEPIDIVRELGILFDRRRRLDILQRLGSWPPGGRVPALLDAIRQREKQIEHHDLALTTSVRRYAGMAGHRDLSAAEDQLRAATTAAGDADTVPRIWPALCAHLYRAAPALGLWDRLVIGTSFICHDEPGAICTIDNDGVDEWMAGLGHMVPLARDLPN